MTRRWFITGCSTGLGRALAEAVAASGDLLFATARRVSVLEPLRTAYPRTVWTAGLDVRDPAACASAVETAVARLGGLDVLVNNAGYGQLGTVEEVGDEELAAQFATNVFAPWRLTRLVLPHLRAQRHGDIVMVSSMSSRVAYPGLSAYTATKFALEGLVEALHAELSGSGVRVVSVQPGAFATDWGTACVPAQHTVADYTDLVAPMHAGVRQLKHLPISSPPDLFAREVLRIVAAPQRPLRWPVGEDAWQTAITQTTHARDELLDAQAARLAATI